MSYKTEKMAKNFKKYSIIFAVIWLVLTILFVAPVSYAITETTANGKFVLTTFLEYLIPAISSFTSITKVFDGEYIGTFIQTEIIFTALLGIVIVIGLVKSAPKHQYSDIEHGSSDWSEGGEQYKILSKKSGIILAQNNYLPINKRGNVNVLVVGRIRFW